MWITGLIFIFQLETAFRDFENVCPADIDRSPSSMFYSMLRLLKIQIVLKHLRQEPPAIDEFEECVKLLFLSNRGKVSVVEPAVAETYKELMAIPESKRNSSPQYPKLIEKVLQKYDTQDFLRVFNEFTKSHQSPVMLDAIIADIDSAFYVPRIATGPGSSAQHSGVLPVSLDVDGSKQQQQTQRQPPPEKQQPEQQEPPAQQLQRTAKPSNSDKIKTVKRPHLQLSAWQLRKGLKLAHDEVTWTAVHQVRRKKCMFVNICSFPILVRRVLIHRVCLQETHPAVLSFTNSIAQQTKESNQQKLSGKRRCPESGVGAAKEKDDGETESDNEEGNLDVEVTESDAERNGIRLRGKGVRNVVRSPPNRSRRVQAPAPASVSSSSQSPAHSLPAHSPAVAPGSAGDVVGALRESRRALRSAVQDPLDDVRKAAAAVVPIASSGEDRVTSKTKVIDVEADGPGRAVQVNNPAIYHPWPVSTKSIVEYDVVIGDLSFPLPLTVELGG
jgi:hypothetical protein